MARSPERGGRYTFESDWVVKENEWARDKGIPIIALYDGDRSRERMEAPERENECLSVALVGHRSLGRLAQTVPGTLQKRESSRIIEYVTRLLTMF